MSKIIFSLSSIQPRRENLNLIIPNILKQCDKLYVNLVGGDNIPQISNHPKIQVNQFDKAGSEIRFFNYNDIDDDSYYFTIDDDILYPLDYVRVMVDHMKKYKNKSVCCVHGSIVDLNLRSDYYRQNRIVYYFPDELSENTQVNMPGVGTSCFYKKNVNLNIKDFIVPNMSDPYTGCFLSEQNIKKVAIKRKKDWLIQLNQFNKAIWGNNPHDEIDKVINHYKNHLINETSQNLKTRSGYEESKIYYWSTRIKGVYAFISGLKFREIREEILKIQGRQE
ncbi:MAG: hypothetical protein CVU55_11675 [Deltaproteobacteria bacterium HGW-Deltaproteobacteria-13]|jgi:hypothetical protein|nr:MAG: hypothetical protein CVU55_11675 [Deltaproteobacteria bacterium HGW-Deltaproteobacteria-13]